VLKLIYARKYLIWDCVLARISSSYRLNSLQGSSAYVGFTAGTGYYYMTAEVAWGSLRSRKKEGKIRQQYARIIVHLIASSGSSYY
jgi:hypothetical protein